MEPGADIIRFSDTAIFLKHPLMVTMTIVFVVALLSTHYVPGGSFTDEASPGRFWTWVGWIVLALLPVVGMGLVWLLGSSREVEVDPASKRVTQRYLFFKYETAKSQWNFSEFTGVRVAQETSKEESATTSPGSKGYQSAIKTSYSHSYTVSLLRADTVVTLPDQKKMSVPHYPLELPMEKQQDPLPLEAIARQLSKLGGWPATRRGYAVVAGVTSGDVRGPNTVKSSPHDAETPISAE